MAITIYGCGFNGFGQLSGFRAQITHAGWVDMGKQSNCKAICSSSVASPVPLMHLSENVKVDKTLITWSRIAVTLQKEKRNTTLVSGTAKPSLGKCTVGSTVEVYDATAVAATDCDIFIKHPGEDDKISLLYDGGEQPREISIQSDSNPEKNKIDIHSSSSEMFYTKGLLEFGQLKLERRESELSLLLRPLDASIKISSVSCGKEHALLLNTLGSIYSYGLGSRGQLGHGDVERQDSIRLIEALEGVHVKKCSAGGWHSACISEFGDAYTWGWDECGQLGLTRQTSTDVFETQGIVTVPQCVTLPRDVSLCNVACGARHSLVLSECGKVFSSGWNGYGQLGVNHNQNKSCFVHVSLGLTCHQIFAGQWCSIFCLS